MEPTKFKLLASIIIAVLIIAALPFIGTTSMAQDDSEGLVIDFGYWDASWTETPLTEGMNGIELLQQVCRTKEYSLVLNETENAVIAINGQEGLPDRPWTLFVLADGAWQKITTSPTEVNVADYSVLTWARASSPDELTPGADASGFEYYGYGDGGKSPITGSQLRIVSLSPTITEMIVAAGGLDLLVGTDLYSNYPDAVVDKQQQGEISITGGYTDPNYEKIVGLPPDIVFCDQGVGSHTHMADKLRKSGINCVMLYDTTGMDRVYDNLWITASALGYNQRGKEVIDSINATIDSITGIVGNSHDQDVFVTLSTNNAPFTSGKETYISDVIGLAGGNNVFDSLNQTWIQVGIEAMHSKQPEVIIIVSETYVGSEEEYQKIINGLGNIWKDTPASKNGEIYIFSGKAADLLSRSGPRLGEATELLAKVLHPANFLQKDPADVIPHFFGDDYQQYLQYQNEVFF